MKKTKKVKKAVKKVKKAKPKITKNMTIATVLAKNPKAAQILFKEGLHCLGCPSASYESLEAACQMHGLNLEKILKKLNK
jgi:hydroxylamine reductase